MYPFTLMGFVAPPFEWKDVPHKHLYLEVFWIRWFSGLSEAGTDMHQPLHQEPHWKDINTEQQTNPFSNSLVYSFAFMAGEKESSVFSCIFMCMWLTYIYYAHIVFIWMLWVTSTKFYVHGWEWFTWVNLQFIWEIQLPSFHFWSPHTFFTGRFPILLLWHHDNTGNVCRIHCRYTGNREGLGMPWWLERKGFLSCL